MSSALYFSDKYMLQLSNCWTLYSYIIITYSNYNHKAIVKRQRFYTFHCYNNSTSDINISVVIAFDIVITCWWSGDTWWWHGTIIWWWRGGDVLIVWWPMIILWWQPGATQWFNDNGHAIIGRQDCHRSLWYVITWYWNGNYMLMTWWSHDDDNMGMAYWWYGDDAVIAW